MIQDDDITIIGEMRDVIRSEKNFKKNLKSEIGTYYSIHNQCPTQIELIYDPNREFGYDKKYMSISLESEQIQAVEGRAILHHSPYTEHNANRNRIKEIIRELTELYYQKILDTIHESSYDQDMRSYRAKTNFRWRVWSNKI